VFFNGPARLRWANGVRPSDHHCPDFLACLCKNAIGYAAPYSGAPNHGADRKTAKQKDDLMNETSISFVDSEARAPVPLSSPEHALSAANLP
jgi:hypothetical protein